MSHHCLNPILSVILLSTCLTLPVFAETSSCHQESHWFLPEDKHFSSSSELIHELRNQQVVLLGEQHDVAEHHRWQLQTISEIHAVNDNIALGFEMFPRRVQAALDAWVAGKLNEKEFLEQSEWQKVWGYDAQLYMPLFHFARINHIPMVALNIDRSAVRLASKKGVEAMSKEERLGVSLPAKASADYIELLATTFGGHGHGSGETDSEDIKNNAQFLRFVDAQQLWDRAMAEGIANTVLSSSAPLVIGVMGTGHIVERFGVPHQLNDLDVRKVKVLLPGDSTLPCKEVTARTADGIFGLPDYEEITSEVKPRLGVHLLHEDGAVKITKIVDKSIAEDSGLQQDDVFITLAGKHVKTVKDVVDIVQAMQAGTWLPIEINRGGKAMEIIAKFPHTLDKQIN